MSFSLRDAVQTFINTASVALGAAHPPLGMTAAARAALEYGTEVARAGGGGIGAVARGLAHGVGAFLADGAEASVQTLTGEKRLSPGHQAAARLSQRTARLKQNQPRYM